MESLIKFILRFQFIIIFVILESFSIWLLADSSYYQKAKFGKLTKNITATLFNHINNMGQYIRLKESNIELASENVALRNEIARIKSGMSLANIPRLDSLKGAKYRYLKARVINNSVNKQHNFITLNVGYKQGIAPDMGIICGDGVVGIIASVSMNYSTAISLLNLNFKVSAKHRKTGFFGSLYWDGVNYREVMLAEIPQHAQLAIGDTIVTSGYSQIFPPEIPLGTISSFEHGGGNFYVIRVELLADFKRLDYVSVIQSLQEEERTQLENKNGND